MSLRDDAISIWRAGLSAVDSAAAIRRGIVSSGKWLEIAGQPILVDKSSRIEVLGAGKAGAGMAAGFESALADTTWLERLSGWVNVPEGCFVPLQRIHLHPARPPGRNEPTPAVVSGTEEILRRARGLRENDVCVVLLSGGASALLCSPHPGITLQDKLAVTRMLSASGAPIEELNLVRTQLSQIKGGGLAKAVTGGRLIVLVISDVIGDSLEVIGSGPTTVTPPRRTQARDIIRRRQLWDRIPASVRECLLHDAEAEEPDGPLELAGRDRRVHHQIVASNSIALEAAAARASELGYRLLPVWQGICGEASVAGRAFSDALFNASRHSGRWCLLGGGETTVKLNAADGSVQQPGLGGRNQEFVLSAAVASPGPADWEQRVLLSGGTDGEDGPTVAAGAFCDAEILACARALGMNLSDFLRRHDSFSLFQRIGGLFITGPTQTNVMDLAVGLAVGSDV